MSDSNNISKLNAYSALSGCYLPPDKNLGVLLDQFRENLGSWIPEAQKYLDSMTSELQNQENGLQELTLDYSRLFLGPFEVLAPPFGSVYLNQNKKMIMDETTGEVAEMYRNAGLEVDDSFNNPADHITAELEFMHYLYFQEHAAFGENNEKQAEKFQKIRREFFRKHLGKWGPTFAHKVQENAQMDFYRQLALVTRLVLATEAEEQVNDGQ
jgi:putative dimethyl sulfoxide reductase chaperone